MSIADRALAAYESEQEQKRIQAELKQERSRGIATVVIMEAAERLGVEINISNLEHVGPSWQLKARVDDDATLIFSVTDAGGLTMSVRPADQLYWDLPPGQEEKGPGGGTYGCYQLHSYDREIVTLADLGRQITNIRRARGQWRAKHEKGEQ